MFELVCSVHEGVFSNERLVTFSSVDGTPYSALVDSAHLVSDEMGDGKVRVRAHMEGERAVVLLPNSGDRVLVSSAQLNPVPS
jgi:hypothetical protein